MTEIPVYIHDLHHHVLRSWKVLQSGQLPVITLDHHTDILPAFLRYSEQFCYPDNAGNDLEKDIAALRHDEHFDYAVRYGLISHAYIISHTRPATVPGNNIQVLCEGAPNENEPLNSAFCRRYFDRALEDDFLERYLDLLPKNDYIFDIDCDYFKTIKSLEPSSVKIFRKMLHNARMITFSREDDWVKLLTFENPSIFTSQYIIDAVKKLF